MKSREFSFMGTVSEPKEIATIAPVRFDEDADSKLHALEVTLEADDTAGRSRPLSEYVYSWRR